MAGMDEEATSPPFGMSPALPAFHRATRVAEALFGGAEASVVLVDGQRVWRSGGRLVGAGIPAPGPRLVIERGRALWIVDWGLAPTLELNGPHSRFWAGAPVRLADGSTIGVLRVMSAEPRAYDRTLASRL